MAEKQLSDGGADGTVFGQSATDLISFYGVTPVVQPVGAAQAALTVTTATAGGFAFTTSAGFNALIAQVEEIRASLVTLGLLKGGA